MQPSYQLTVKFTDKIIYSAKNLMLANDDNPEVQVCITDWRSTYKPYCTLIKQKYYFILYLKAHTYVCNLRYVSNYDKL